MLWLTKRTVRPSTLSLKRHVADGQHFVNKQDLRFEVCRDCKRQARVHSCRISLHRGVQECADFGKRHDLIELALDLDLLHPKNGAIQKHVFAPGQLRMKARSNLQQAGDSPA
jgi:hypothetical protein